MRILADENISKGLTVALVDAGHDVERVGDVIPSAEDEVVLRHAVTADRILLTFDADFGAMIFAQGLAAPRGVIYLRSPPPSPAETIARVLRIARSDAPAIDGYFVSVDRNARYHPLPQGEIDG